MYEEGARDRQIGLIYEQYYRDVYHFMIYFTGNRSVAEDLTQEVFLRVLDSLKRYEERASMKTWILRIAKYVAIDHSRKKRIRAWFGMETINKIPSKLGQPEEEYAGKEGRRHVVEAVLRMKPKYRSVLILHGLKEYNIKETAEILCCSEGKVKVDYHRAMKEMRRFLEGDIERGWINEYS
ncbi:RNA polymerase sigma factor [Brevibacillus laterosporus]|uniref:RNA polymerase sigma factor n=1 Tax=Brevibacillus laterosporus TaxID=1465 RepID=UPI002650E220|nr:RNA polymerase sigma factor [Brevibacillus laterosporus]MDN9011229.1 RNA polymerase sigma factor [Brevibacillus laterosporus]MDO0942252.1 RNA polymerase sigma factor [Brevibacillus laterosporus]